MHGAIEWPDIHEGVMSKVPGLLPWIHAATSTTPPHPLGVQITTRDNTEANNDTGTGPRLPHVQPAIPNGDPRRLGNGRSHPQTQYPEGIIYSYQDDVTLVAHPDALATCAILMVQELKKAWNSTSTTPGFGMVSRWRGNRTPCGAR